jgi:DNA-binding NarL/FixJ family response regulator
MKRTLVLIVTKQGTLQTGLLALVTTIPQISTVLVAEDANIALRMLNEHCPRLLLLDMDLPEDGAQNLLKEIKSQSPSIGTIAIVDNAQQKQETETLGANVVLFKGFQAVKIITIIENILAE